MYKVYGDMLSGNCFKVKLILQFLGIPHEWQHVDIVAGETQTSEFKAINPAGKIPVLIIDETKSLSESNAIINYLADGSSFLPSTAFERAQVLQWQFFEQYSHEPYIAVARYINTFLGLPEEKRELYESKQQGGHNALAVMENHLAQHDFFVGTQPTIADISLYAYTHVADEGGFDLSNYPNINKWLNRMSELDGYVPMAR